MFGLDIATDKKTSPPSPAESHLPAPALREITDELSDQYRTYLRGAMGLATGETQLQVLSGGLDEA